jgi:hypothetical protein
MASLQNFRGLIFTDAGNHAHYALYNRIYFTGLIFTDSRLSAKTAKIGSHENFLLYDFYAPGGPHPKALFSMHAILKAEREGLGKD